MLFSVMSDTVSPIGTYIKEQLRLKQLQDRRWSQNELARRAGLSSGGLSMIISGQIKAEGDTLKAIADALQIDARPLLQLAGLLETEDSELEPDVAFVAQQLNRLPAEVRSNLLDVVRGILATVEAGTGTNTRLLAEPRQEGYSVGTREPDEEERESLEDIARALNLSPENRELLTEFLRFVEGEEESDPGLSDEVRIALLTYLRHRRRRSASAPTEPSEGRPPSGNGPG